MSSMPLPPPPPPLQRPPLDHMNSSSYASAPVTPTGLIYDEEAGQMKGTQANVLKRPPSGGWGKKDVNTEGYKELEKETKGYGGRPVSAMNSRTVSMSNTPNGSHVILDEPMTKTKVSLLGCPCFQQTLTRRWTARKGLLVFAHSIYCDALAPVHRARPWSPLDSWYSLIDYAP
jgi:hypothetical protein